MDEIFNLTHPKICKRNFIWTSGHPQMALSQKHKRWNRSAGAKIALTHSFKKVTLHYGVSQKLVFDKQVFGGCKLAQCNVCCRQSELDKILAQASSLNEEQKPEANSKDPLSPSNASSNSRIISSSRIRSTTMHCNGLLGKILETAFFHVEPKAKMLSEKTSSANVNPMSFLHVVFRVGVIVHVVFRVGVKL